MDDTNGKAGLIVQPAKPFGKNCCVCQQWTLKNLKEIVLVVSAFPTNSSWLLYHCETNCDTDSITSSANWRPFLHTGWTLIWLHRNSTLLLFTISLTTSVHFLYYYVFSPEPCTNLKSYLVSLSWRGWGYVVFTASFMKKLKWQIRNYFAVFGIPQLKTEIYIHLI